MMAEATTPEPSIEEILASIRKIISDDDVEPEAGEHHAAEPVHKDEPVLDEDEDDILELTTIAEEPAADNVIEMPPVYHHEPEEIPHEPAFEIHETVHEMPETPRSPSAEDGSIVSDRAMAAATGAFAKLTHADEPADTHTGDGRTVEDITRELLKPMLRQWIDQNLPQIVERLVEKELRKISRKAEDL